jgi:hypothetical protein
MDLFKIYQEWCKDTKRNGSVLVGKSIRELLLHLEDKIKLSDVKITTSADGELCVLRKDEEGEHYIVADGSMSYVLVSKTPGKYKTLHTENGASISEIVENFLKNKE